MELKKLVLAFMCVAVRLTPAFLAVGLGPLQRVPTFVRLVLIIVSTISIAALIEPKIDYSVSLLYLLLAEFLMGLIIFFPMQLVFAAIGFWGRLMDMQIGFSAAGIFHPGASSQESLIGTTFSLAAISIFFLLGIHHQFLNFILLSYDAFPIGKLVTGFNVMTLTSFMTAVFSVALMMFAPVIIMLWLLDVFAGFLSKNMPQMNVYFVLLPLKIAVGLYLLSVLSFKSNQVFLALFEQLKSILEIVSYLMD